MTVLILDDYVSTPTDPAAREAFKQWYERIFSLEKYKRVRMYNTQVRQHVLGMPVQDHDLGDEDEMRAAQGDT